MKGTSNMTQPLAPWEEAYQDWRDLLDRADASDLIHDPKSVWDEAWRQALMQSLSFVIDKSNSNEDIEKKIRQLLKC